MNQQKISNAFNFISSWEKWFIIVSGIHIKHHTRNQTPPSPNPTQMDGYFFLVGWIDGRMLETRVHYKENPSFMQKRYIFSTKISNFICKVSYAESFAEAFNYFFKTPTPPYNFIHSFDFLRIWLHNSSSLYFSSFTLFTFLIHFLHKIYLPCSIELFYSPLFHLGVSFSATECIDEHTKWRKSHKYTK